MQLRVRQLIRLCGMALSVLALGWIAMRFINGGVALLVHLDIAPMRLVAMLLADSLGYALAMCFPALAWRMLLVSLHANAGATGNTLATYAISQYGKYLPGNVAHYALRHAWSRRHGVPHASLGLASLLEAGLFVLAALCVIIATGTGSLRLPLPIDPRWAIALLLLALIAAWIGLRWASHRTPFGLQLPSVRLRVLPLCVGLYLGFFVTCAGLLAVIAHGLGIRIESLAALLVAGTASWLAGFVVIGAPAGLGVREATFVALTATTMGDGRALLLIGVFRAVTFLGDTLFFAAGMLYARIDARRSGQRAG